MLNELSSANKVVGVKQTKKAIKDGLAVKVFVAADAEARVIRPVIDLCTENGTDYETVPTMKELGSACGIEVGSACAAIKK